MTVIFVTEYYVLDDFNWMYSYSVVIDGVKYHLCSVNNSEDGPAGKVNSIEELTRNLIGRVRVGEVLIPASSSGGNFRSEGIVEVSEEEIDKIIVANSTKN